MNNIKITSLSAALQRKVDNIPEELKNYLVKAEGGEQITFSGVFSGNENDFLHPSGLMPVNTGR